MDLATPEGTLILDHVNEVDVRADPDDWQVELSRTVGSTVVWWDNREEEVILHVGIVGDQPPEDVKFFDARPLRFARLEVPTVTLIGAVDHGPATGWLMMYDGYPVDERDAASSFKNDRAWLIPPTDGPLITHFSMDRWRLANQVARKGRPMGSARSPSSRPALW